VNVPITPAFTVPSALTASSIVKGIPDLAIYGIGAVILFSVIGGLAGGRRRR
jgi:hypothetical protein